jgi:hypothetical protein
MECQHRKRNYRVMFKFELVCLALGITMTVLGGIGAADAAWFAFGLLMVILSVGNAYLTVDSTVRVIEAETEEARSRSEYERYGDSHTGGRPWR